MFFLVHFLCVMIIIIIGMMRIEDIYILYIIMGMMRIYIWYGGRGGDAALGSMDCGTSSAAQIILDTSTLLCIKSWKYYELNSKHTLQIIHK